MEVVPILRAMRCSKTAVSLMVLQVALTLAIACNSAFIIHDRLSKIGRPTGMAMDDIFYATTVGYAPDYDAAGATRVYLDLLRGMPGVVDATVSHQLPLSGGGWSREFRLSADLKAPATTAGVMLMDEHGLETLGLKLVAGRGFTETEVEHASGDAYRSPPVVIVTQAAADALFPGGDALGKTIYNSEGDTPETIVGVVERLQGFWPHWDGFERTMILPAVYEGFFNRFLVRTLPGQRDRVMQAAATALERAHTGAYVRSLRSLDDYRDNTYRDDHAMAVVLSVVTGVILAITALGMAGLASFSVRQRTKQIGTRRALGARRRDIVHHFLTENWLITSLGLVLGSAFAVGLNFWLVDLYDLPPLAWYYIPLGFLCLWILGLAATLGPALKAAEVPPAVATRSV